MKNKLQNGVLISKYFVLLLLSIAAQMSAMELVAEKSNSWLGQLPGDIAQMAIKAAIENSATIDEAVSTIKKYATQTNKLNDLVTHDVAFNKELITTLSNRFALDFNTLAIARITPALTKEKLRETVALKARFMPLSYYAFAASRLNTPAAIAALKELNGGLSKGMTVLSADEAMDALLEKVGLKSNFKRK